MPSPATTFWGACPRRATAKYFARKTSLPAASSHYMTSANPIAVINAYAQALPTSGWTVTSSGESDSEYGGNAGLQATNGAKYLSINAGGPAGTTYVSVCVWPSKPDRDYCSIDN